MTSDDTWTRRNHMLTGKYFSSRYTLLAAQTKIRYSTASLSSLIRDDCQTTVDEEDKNCTTASFVVVLFFFLAFPPKKNVYSWMCVKDNEPSLENLLRIFLSLGHAHRVVALIFILFVSVDDAKSDWLRVKLVNELDTTRIYKIFHFMIRLLWEWKVYSEWRILRKNSLGRAGGRRRIRACAANVTESKHTLLLINLNNLSRRDKTLSRYQNS